jgi:hypothetical protein
MNQLLAPLAQAKASWRVCAALKSSIK